MKTLLILMILLSAGMAQAQERATVKFRWTQPDTTSGGTVMADGQMKGYNIYLAAHGDTLFYGIAPAPTALADSAWAYINMEIGVPSAIQVEPVDKWDQVGRRSPWSDVHVIIPEPPAAAGKPNAIE